MSRQIANLWILTIFFLPKIGFAQQSVIDLPNNFDKNRQRTVPVTFHLPKQKSAQPLVLVSHGGAGTRDGLYSLASAISDQGYIVMCLEHISSNLENIIQRMRSERLSFRNALIDCGKDETARRNRPQDVRFAIDLAKRLNHDDDRFKNRIDLSRIAILGHSYGAYTTMACCGVKPVNIKEDLREPRIKLGIALSPQAGNGSFFDKNSFSKVTVPFAGISGTKDLTQFITSVEQRKDFFKLMPAGDKHLIWIHDAGHFSFSDPTGSKRRISIPPDKDVTEALKVIVPSLLNRYLRNGAELDESNRKNLIKKCLRGKVHQIDWQVK